MQSLFYRFNQNKLVHNKLQIQVLFQPHLRHHWQQRDIHRKLCFLRLFQPYLHYFKNGESMFYTF